MSKHIINVSDLKDYTKEYEIAGSYGKDEHKTLALKVNLLKNTISFTIYEKDEIIGKFNNLIEAIEFYNII